MERDFDDIYYSEDEEENEIIEEKSHKRKKYLPKTGAILFLIDARKNMLSSELNDKESCLVASLKCVRNTMRYKIFNEEKCQCGIILMGTKSKNNSLNLSNLTIIHDLFLLEAEHIIKVDEVIKAVENSLYEKKFGFDEYSLGDAFWLATQILCNRPPTYNKSIVLFTNNDNPVTTEKNDYTRALVIAEDMYKHFIMLQLVFLANEFDENKFYKKLLQIVHHDVNYLVPEPATSLHQMEQMTKKTNYRHLTLRKLPFVIGNGFTIGVSIFFLIRKMKVPYKVKLSKATNEKVTTKLQLFETETGSVVDEDNIIKSQCFGHKNINFNMKELKSISEYGSVGLQLLGFKPASAITLENFVRPCAFIYPDETTYKGSFVFFTALLQRCVAKQVVPICTLCLKPNGVSRFVVLVAQNENVLIEKGKNLPQGFVAFFLPFSEEIRVIDDYATKRAEPEQMEIAVKLIKKLKFKYKVESFTNPRLRTHWAAIEALALNLPEAENVGDSTYPNYDLISNRIGNLAHEFINTVYDDDYDPQISGASRRRKPVTKTSEEKLNIENVEELVREGKGETLPNDVLKAYLKSVGLGRNLSKVKKSDLLDKIRKYLEID